MPASLPAGVPARVAGGGAPRPTCRRHHQHAGGPRLPHRPLQCWVGLPAGAPAGRDHRGPTVHAVLEAGHCGTVGRAAQVGGKRRWCGWARVSGTRRTRQRRIILAAACLVSRWKAPVPVRRRTCPACIAVAQVGDELAGQQADGGACSGAPGDARHLLLVVARRRNDACSGGASRWASLSVNGPQPGASLPHGASHLECNTVGQPVETLMKRRRMEEGRRQTALMGAAVPAAGSSETPPRAPWRPPRGAPQPVPTSDVGAMTQRIHDRVRGVDHVGAHQRVKAGSQLGVGVVDACKRGSGVQRRGWQVLGGPLPWQGQQAHDRALAARAAPARPN